MFLASDCEYSHTLIMSRGDEISRCRLSRLDEGPGNITGPPAMVALPVVCQRACPGFVRSRFNASIISYDLTIFLGG